MIVIIIIVELLLWSSVDFEFIETFHTKFISSSWLYFNLNQKDQFFIFIHLIFDVYFKMKSIDIQNFIIHNMNIMFTWWYYYHDIHLELILSKMYLCLHLYFGLSFHKKKAFRMIRMQMIMISIKFNNRNDIMANESHYNEIETNILIKLKWILFIWKLSDYRMWVLFGYKDNRQGEKVFSLPEYSPME